MTLRLPLPRLFAVAALCALSACARAGLSAPQRIASLNLCTDQLLLMLVPRARIASVTDWAALPASSYMAAAAAGVPVNHGLAEEVLQQRPDLVVTGEYNDPTMVGMMRRLGYRVAVMQVPQTLALAQAFIVRFGDLVGAPDRARALAARMQRQLAALEARVAALRRASGSGREPLAAVYAPNGMTPGRHTVLADILARAGFRNLASELGIDGYGELSLERLLAARPDILVFEATADTHGDGSIAQHYLQHPALRALERRALTVTLPPTMSECVGPMTVAAVARMVDTRARWQARSATAGGRG